MWYLVVPPIVIVLSLFFLVWYLLRRQSDPAIAQKVLESEKAAPQAISTLRESFLRFLEKFAQRFKVGLLRAHNSLHELTQSLKKMRRGTADLRPSHSLEAEGLPVKQEEVSREASNPQTYDVLEASIARRERGDMKREGDTKKGAVLEKEKKEFAPRPTVSEVLTQPEEKKRASVSVREEQLIARIAKDPKDFTAYEELGDHYLDTGNIKDAKECYRQVLKLSPVHRLVKIKIRRLEKLLTRSGE